MRSHVFGLNRSALIQFSVYFPLTTFGERENEAYSKPRIMKLMGQRAPQLGGKTYVCRNPVWRHYVCCMGLLCDFKVVGYAGLDAAEGPVSPEAEGPSQQNPALPDRANARNQLEGSCKPPSPGARTRSRHKRLVEMILTEFCD